MKIALVTDYLNQHGGAERVLEILIDMFPDAPIYTLLYSAERTRHRFDHKKVITSYLDSLPFGKRRHRILFPFMPHAVESWDFSEYDLVISLSAAFAKGIKVKRPTKHIAYLFTPTRFLWDEAEEKLQEELPWIARQPARAVSTLMKKWDYRAAHRPHAVIALSRYRADSILRHYGRIPDRVIYPSVDDAALRQIADIAIPRNPYYLIVSRLIPYKRVDIAIQACRALGRKLIVIGAGRDDVRLRTLAGEETTFLGEVTDDVRNAYIVHARAFIMPQVEDFGIAAAEAQWLGTPVVAFGQGGAAEIVVENKTGIFFMEQTVASLSRALEIFEQSSFDRGVIRESSQRFSKERFMREFREAVDSL